MAAVNAKTLKDYPAEAPLVVDLDGTLLRSDSLWELFSHAIRAVDWKAPLQLRRGKAAFKKYLANNYQLEMPTAPWNNYLVELINQAKNDGREVWLATGADMKLAARVKDFFGLNGYFASDGEKNCVGNYKVALLIAAFGEGGFIYAGNCNADFPVWSHAAGVISVCRTRLFANRVMKKYPSASIVDLAYQFNGLKRVLRTHQWAKNILIFLPIFLARDFSLNSIFKSLLAFVIFCMVGSAGYIFNDLVDLDSDRNHPIKKGRPFASGEIPLQLGWCFAAGLIISAFALASTLNKFFVATVMGYLLLTCIYSLFLKTIFLFDIFILTSFYILRIFAGCMAISVPLSTWVATSSFFLFLSLACTKRVNELGNRHRDNGIINSRRGYMLADKDILYQASISTATCAVIPFCLYVMDTSSIVLYQHKSILLMIAPVFYYWQIRIVFLANRGLMNEDPVMFAIKDRQTYLCAAIIVILYALSI